MRTELRVTTPTKIVIDEIAGRAFITITPDPPPLLMSHGDGLCHFNIAADGDECVIACGRSDGVTTWATLPQLVDCLGCKCHAKYLERLLCELKSDSRRR